ncbi:MAG: chloride channel protein [Verrucomicrobiia bacterium]|jgi:H+/Cl- antiporter ClcA
MQGSLDSNRHIEVAAGDTVGFRLGLISTLAGGIGIGAGLIAYLLLKLIGLFTNLFFFGRLSAAFTSPAGNHLGLWVILLPAAGGLVVGLMAKYGTSKIKGHGIPEAMEAVLTSRSRIHPKVAVLKPLSVAVAIGTGGPFGAEGPIIQTGGAVGSLVGQMVRMTAVERKVLLACGAGAGMSATFNTPIAGVILAIELLLFEFRPRSFIPLVVASTLATATRFVVMGRQAMFEMGSVDFGIPSNLLYYILLGVVCGFAAVGFSRALYWVEDQFEHLPIDELWWPAIGGLGLGVIGFFMPRVLGVGYDTISDILNERLALNLLLGIMVLKALALLISLGSGTSGGLLAPMFMTSAAMGAVFAAGVNHLIPGAHLPAGAFALVAMGAVFGAAANATFTFIIFAFEITRDYNAVLPLMLVCVVASGIARQFMRASIMTEKLARRGLRVDQEYETNVLQQVTVGEIMDKRPPTVSSAMKVAELADQIAQNQSSAHRRQATLVLDNTNRLVGIVTRGDVLRLLKDDPTGAVTVGEACSTVLIVTYPDESVQEAMTKLLVNNIGRLPVVQRESPRAVVGYLGRAEVMAARTRRHEEEHVREPGWLSRTA